MSRQHMHDNLTMLTDFYEIMMANGFFVEGHEETIAYFDVFLRKIPDGGGFAIMAGVEQVIEYINDLKFTVEDIDYLRTRGFSEAFLEYLKDFKFTCDIWSVPEGTPIFAQEPIVTVRGPIIQAQFIETMILSTINHQSLIATKANRITRAAKGRDVIEFGSRHAHGYDSAIYGARAAYIGGCCATSNTMCDRDFGIPLIGTMSHSWIQSFDNELDAFCAYAKNYPQDCTLLVDTYKTITSGIPNAIRAFNQEILPRGYRPKAVRIDSGDITYLSKKARKLLDDAGFSDCKIVASNSLDEYLIRDMLLQGAKVDMFGVGERLITSASCPIFGGRYSMCAIEKDGEIIPKIKISNNVNKISNPGFKKLWRLFDRDTGKAIADLITLNGENIDEKAPYTLFDPEYTWKKKVIDNFVARPLMRQIFKNGVQVYSSPNLEHIRRYCKEQVNTLWEEVIRFENPHNYYVDLSEKLHKQKHDLISKYL